MILLVVDDCALCYTKIYNFLVLILLIEVINVNASIIIIVLVAVHQIILTMRSIKWHECHSITHNDTLVPLSILLSHSDHVCVNVQIHLRMLRFKSANLHFRLLTIKLASITNYSVRITLRQTVMHHHLACDKKQSVRCTLHHWQICTTCIIDMIS